MPKRELHHPHPGGGRALWAGGGWQPWAGTGRKGHSRVRGALRACHLLTDVTVSGGRGRGPLVAAVCRAREGRP